MDALMLAGFIVMAGFMTGFIVRDRAVRRRRRLERKLGLGM
jgi:hypothetical protein